jgi:hypothetical protein
MRKANKTEGNEKPGQQPSTMMVSKPGLETGGNGM